MDKVLIISSHKILNRLYEVNLFAYVAMESEICTSPESALKTLDDDQNFRAVVISAEDVNQEELPVLIESIKEKIPQAIFVLIGSKDESPDGVIALSNIYDIKAILRTIAQAVKISAKDMAEKAVGDYFPIPLSLVSALKKTHCKVFQREQIKDNEHDYVALLSKDELITNQLDGLDTMGVTHLYVHAIERLRFINRVSLLLVEDLGRDDLSRGEQLNISGQMHHHVAQEIFADDKINDEMAEISKTCIESIKKVMESTPAPQIQNLLASLLESKSGYVYQHGILTTFLAGKIIENMSWGTKEQAEKVAFALFFHDMFLIPIYKKYPDAISEEDLMYTEGVTDQEKQLIIEHAKLAAGVLKTFPRAPIGADMIVAQHHGMTSGEGFAVNFKDDISPLSKVIIVAEEIATGVLVRQEAGKKDLIPKKATLLRLYDRFKTAAFRKVIDAFAHVDI